MSTADSMEFGLWLPGQPAPLLPGGGYTSALQLTKASMVSLPMEIKDDLMSKVDSLTHTHHGTLRLIGLGGTRVSDKMPVAHIASEVPWKLLAVAGLDKQTQEHRQAANFVAASLGRRIDIGDIRPGPHPNRAPDVIALVDGHTVAIEVT